MKVSTREESLARELYTHDMGSHQGEFVVWDKQIEQVKDSYRRQASKLVRTKWFQAQIAEAFSRGAQAVS